MTDDTPSEPGEFYYNPGKPFTLADFWILNLATAGWTKTSCTIWKDPEGRYWRGPYAAYQEMQKRRAESI